MSRAAPSRPLLARRLRRGALGVWLGAAAWVLALAPVHAGPKPPPGALPAGPYPPSFRLAVARAIEGGVERLASLQTEAGHWGSADDEHVMGHTALPLLALLKGGMAPSAEPVTRALKRLRTLAAPDMRTTYGVGCYLMAIHALHAPLVDVFSLEEDGATAGPAAPTPADLRKRLSPADRDALKRGVAFLLKTQGEGGLWAYRIEAEPPSWAYDLSNTQYALLGLRAATMCGEPVPPEVWARAVTGVLTTQAAEGKRVRLVSYRLKDGYAFAKKQRAAVRGFRYKLDKKDGPKGPWTVWKWEPTGSMTGAGVVSLLVAREGLGPKAPARLRRTIDAASRDGLAWLQEHFTVEHNPGEPDRYHLDYLYGLERVGMLARRRFLGTHDWYRLGADRLLAMDAPTGWGDHVGTAFGVLFLKRATAPPQVTER